MFNYEVDLNELNINEHIVKINHNPHTENIFFENEVLGKYIKIKHKKLKTSQK